jgi:hypothetical protein
MNLASGTITPKRGCGLDDCGSLKTLAVNVFFSTLVLGLEISVKNNISSLNWRCALEDQPVKVFKSLL